MTTLDQALDDLREMRRTTGYKLQYCAKIVSKRTGHGYGVLLGAYNKQAARKRKPRKPSRAEFFRMYGD